MTTRSKIAFVLLLLAVVGNAIDRRFFSYPAEIRDTIARLQRRQVEFEVRVATNLVNAITSTCWRVDSPLRHVPTNTTSFASVPSNSSVTNLLDLSATVCRIDGVFYLVMDGWHYSRGDSIFGDEILDISPSLVRTTTTRYKIRSNHDTSPL